MSEPVVCHVLYVTCALGLADEGNHTNDWKHNAESAQRSVQAASPKMTTSASWTGTRKTRPSRHLQNHMAATRAAATTARTCSGDVSEDPYYCAKSSPKGTSFWFYTWQDCDFIYATRNP